MIIWQSNSFKRIPTIIGKRVTVDAVLCILQESQFKGEDCNAGGGWLIVLCPTDAWRASLTSVLPNTGYETFIWRSKATVPIHTEANGNQVDKMDM